MCKVRGERLDKDLLKRRSRAILEAPRRVPGLAIDAERS